ncbi:MAG: GH36-type glycosyl hydrolase domain-containing protein [Gemmatimonadaceae bacterium]
MRTRRLPGADDLLAGPIRGDPLGTEHLAERAGEVAGEQLLTRPRRIGKRTPLLARLQATSHILDAAHERLVAAAGGGADIGPAGDWLLDNFHVVQEHIHEVRESLPRGYYSELPELASGSLAGYPRVYELAITLISHTEGRLDLDNVELFVEAFQRVSPLSLGELWAVPAMLRLGCIESVRRMTMRTVQRLDEVEDADVWAARVQDACETGPAALRTTLDDFITAPRALTAVFISRFLQQIRPIRGGHPSLVRLERWLAEEGMSAEEAGARSTQRLALTQLVMANSITSLRAIAYTDWRTFVENQSATEAVLSTDPAGFYDRMTFATRDHYRHVVEHMARRTGLDEEAVARQAIDLARAARKSDPLDDRRSHVGYYLIGEGLRTLERATGYRLPPARAAHRWVLDHPNTVFFGGILVATIAACAAVLWLAGPVGRTAWLPVLVFGLIPAGSIAVAVVNQLITGFLPPRLLPKLDLDDPKGIPAELRTAVVVPTLIDSVEGVEEALEHLEVQFLANRDRRLHFALLTDFTDAATETTPDDGPVLAAAEEGVRALNARYAPKTGDVFYLLHRPRRWNEREGVWMGWERKRGKLGEFNRFLGGAGDDAFSSVVGEKSALRRVRYVITLDADSVLPPGAARLLVGALAHPLNRAEFDDSGRVVNGYGILQPRVAVSLPSAHSSRFAVIHSGHPGVDPYTTAVSDVYQDLFGEGSFTGKGIYDVDAFERATHGRFPENTLLSHDLIEGSYARAGLVTDITLYDDYPSQYATYSRRKQRWVRGDWQLLRWLVGSVPGPDGDEPNRLSALSRWKIFDNLRRSTVEIGQLAFIVAGWTLLPGSPVRWTLLGLGAVAAPWIVSMLLAILRPPLDRSWRAYYEAVGHDAAVGMQQIALALAFLPHQAWVSADAITRTMWRLMVTRRHLLEWQTASQAEQAVKADDVGVVSADGAAATFWRNPAWLSMRPAVATTAVGLVAIGVLEALRTSALQGPGVPPVLAAAQAERLSQLMIALLPLATLWLLSPVIARALSGPALPPLFRLSSAQRAEALRYARLHWAYFERFVNEGTNWLVPDNFQDDPAPVVAMRTSPTNIGLQLMATMSAHEIGFIDVADLTRRLELTFHSMGKLQQYRGHFLNWYDLRDLRTLEPAYVSTVDSGNLAGHLLAVRQGCLATAGDAATPADIANRLTALARLAMAYVQAMDFRFLFDRQRKLFSIGYDLTSHSADASFYDLLASEARLASFVAIAKRDVPVDHWFHLGRTLTRTAGATALISWSGSMFEYLMPMLVMRSLPFTLLGQASEGAVQRQIAYAAAHRVPWGKSESAYNLRDRHLTYQYRAFGVPDLALKRGLGRDLVIAPYATALAIMVEPARALANLAAIEREGAMGEYGFRDALDYTRPDPGRRLAVVGNYMAHHIGMGLAALTNALADNVWQRYFHAEPLVQAAELLLYERIPRRLLLQDVQTTRADEARPDPELEQPVVREIETAATPQPHVALLGRMPYTIMVSSDGSGYSRYGKLAVTRWQADGTTDRTGQFCYVRDVTSGRTWSASHQPTCAPADWCRTYLATDRVTFVRTDGEVETRLEIAVVPDDAAEVRRLTVTNNGGEWRELELTSYGEIVLAPPESDRAHPAFANLFVETEWHEWCTAVTATRRARSATEQPLWCVHVVDAGDDRVGEVSCETDRARFLGRGRSTRDPIALERDGDLAGTVGSVLDPIFALRTRVTLAPGQAASVAFTTIVAGTREQAFALADRYHDRHAAQRALDLAWASTQVELRELGVTPDDAAMFQDLAGHLLYSNAALRAPQAELRRNEGGQPLLWEQGLSGDWPILLAVMDEAAGLSTLDQLFAAHRYLQRRGMMVDLVIVMTNPPSYALELHDEIMDSLYRASEPGLLDQPGGVFIRRQDMLSAESLQMLRATARVLIHCDGRPLARVLDTADPGRRTPMPGELPTSAALPQTLVEPLIESLLEPVLRPLLRLADRGTGADVGGGDHRGDGGRRDADRSPRRGATAVHPRPAAPATVPVAAPPAATPSSRSSAEAAPADAVPLLFDNGTGGLRPDGRYEIRVRGDRLPPAPWANVIANERGGFLVSERGAGCSWAENSYFYRLTPWHNDPVSDPPSDAIYLADEATGELWSATPAPVRSDLPYTVRHGQGASTFHHERAGIATTLTLGIAGEDAVRLSLLEVTNHDTRPRRLTVTSYAEWTLGALREHTQHQVRTNFDPAYSAIVARNGFDPQFAHWVAFSAMSEPLSGHTADRREFLGRNGSAAAPAALVGGGALSGANGVGIDPCAVLQCVLELAPGETREMVFLLGAAEGQADARRAMDRYREVGHARSAIERTVREWEHRLTAVTVRTPEPSFDAMINRWALYQTLACRLWARSALYQSSGAYGFRDQLQDVMALLHAEPAMAREHILRAAARQFREGDVQHWWHPHSGRGVRTRFSDDLVWLPYVVDHYVGVTGDSSVLDAEVPFLEMRPLKPDEHEVYDLPQVSAETGTIYEHCRRALSRASTVGTHGLPLIGGGDWNDGMNRVGVEGRGESVWLAWFLITTLRGFAGRAELRGDADAATDYRRRADAYQAAVEAHGWDGAWYRRAYFDDGTPLGSSSSDECQIDAIAQSWSVISGAGDPARAARAMQSLEERLVNDDARLLALLTPPFDRTTHDPGYIKGYLPGVRENGAQYTHAALWSVMATAMLGDGERALELFQMINPLTHASTPEGVAVYKVEPYVVAADVYTAEGQLGRGGWTWYTGSASWMYRVGLEALLGFTRRGDSLTIAPRVPASWPRFEIDYRHGRSIYAIVVHEPGGVTPEDAMVTVDGRAIDGAAITLVDDGERHEVVIRPRSSAGDGGRATVAGEAMADDAAG